MRSPMELKRHIGSRIRAARTQAKLTQQQLADRLGKSVDTISNLERGSSLASIETLSGVAAALGVPLAFFFREFPNERPLSSRRGQLIERLNVQALQLSDDELELATRLLAAIQTH